MNFITAEEWVIVGINPANALIVRGGENPVALKVSASGDDLIRLLSDANRGIAAPGFEMKPAAIAREKRKALPAPDKKTRKAVTLHKTSGAGTTEHQVRTVADALNGDASHTPRPPPQGGHLLPQGEKVSGSVVVSNAGVTVSLTSDEEEIEYRGQRMDLNRNQARLAAVLIPAMPAPVDRKFLVGKLWGGAPPASADIMLDARSSDLRKAVAGIGLNVVAVRGVGIMLQAAE